MFEAIFKRQLYKLFILYPNITDVAKIVNAWNLDVIDKWEVSAEEADYLRALSVEKKRKLFTACKVKKTISIYLKENSHQFKADFINSAVQILTEAKDVKPVYAGEQALDALARLLLWRHKEAICICVCVHPIYHYLVVTANSCTLDAVQISESLRVIVQDAQALVDIFSEGGGSRSGLLHVTAGLWEDRKSRVPAELMEARLQLDLLKYFKFFANIAKLQVRVPVYQGAHADMQLIEHIEVSLRNTATHTMPMYMGDAMRCCAKCETLIQIYNSCGFNKVKVSRKGYHPAYDFSGWTCPSTLRSIITNNGHNARSSQLLNALIFYEQPSTVSMHADLSDDDD